MISYLEYLNVPTKIAISIVIIVVIAQVVGEILELKGKVVPEWIKFRKYFARKKREREELSQALKDVQVLLKERTESANTLKEVKSLLKEVNAHYSADNIKKRDNWMQWVNSRAVVYDESIEKFHTALSDVTSALKDNTKMTEEMFVQTSRDRIIDFATKVENKNVVVSREEFNRIFKVYDKYEKFLEERGLKNGEIDINYDIIKESYEEHVRNHTFLEDRRGIAR